VTPRSGGAGRAGAPPPAPEPLAHPVVDSHCHLDLVEQETGTDPSEAVAAAVAVGVGRIVTIGVDVETSRWQAELAARLPEVWAGVAIHPNEAGSGAATAAALAQIEALAARPEVRAVGETGLDHYRTPPAGHRAQEASFRAHIDIARATGKALVIHDRDAHDDVARILTGHGEAPVTVFHCFSGDAEFARRCARAGWYTSFAGNMTFSNAGALRAAAAVMPQELLLVETDAPFLTPVPHRGRPNGSYLVPLTVRALAEVRGEDLDSLCAALWRNSERVFGPL
jgi:TatD DNase family protein